MLKVVLFLLSFLCSASSGFLNKKYSSNMNDIQNHASKNGTTRTIVKEN